MAVTILKEYDAITGELIREEKKEQSRIILPDGALRIHSNSKRKFGQEYKIGNKFNFVVDKAVRNLMDELDLKDIGYLTVLSTYENYEGILFSTVRAKHPMNVREIRTALGVSRNEIAQRIIDKLIELEAIKAIEVEKNGFFYDTYMISDDFFFKGRIKKSNRGKVTKQFTTRMRELYKCNGAAATGFTAVLMQYLDTENNFLLKDTNSIAKPEGMSQQDIAKITKLSKAQVNNRLRNMKIQGYSVWEFSSTKETGTRYRLNPLVANKMADTTFENILKNFTLKGTDI